MLLSETIVNNIKNTGHIKKPAIFFYEGEYLVKSLTKKDEIIKSHYLRHRIFCRELGWRPLSADYMEIDEYDRNAVFFGVFNKNSELLAYIRLIISEDNFMMEKEFPELIGASYKISKIYNSVEASRLCIAEEARDDKIIGNFGIHSLSLFIYKAIYQWCLGNNRRYLYGVAELKIHRLLCSKGFPCKPIGKPVMMPDGVLAVAVILDWYEFISLNEFQRPKMLNWFNQYQPGRIPQRSRRLDTGSQHQVFA